MIRRLALSCALLILLASSAVPAFSQGGGAAEVSLSHQFDINSLGFGVLNDTLTFHNGGSGPVQIPVVQVGIPASIAPHAAGFVLSNGNFTMTKSVSNGATTIAVSPVRATLAPGADASVALKSMFFDVLNISAGSSRPISATVLLSPSLNVEVSSLKQVVRLPPSATLRPIPQGFAAANGSSSSYSKTSANVTPAGSAGTFSFLEANQGVFTPLRVFSFLRSIVPSSAGSPQIRDTISFQNLANYTLTSLHFTMIRSNITQVTIVPSGTPPLLNPRSMTLSNGYLFLTETPFGANLGAGDNLTLTMVYDAPSSLIKASGTQVTISVPDAPSLPAVALNYTARLSLEKGISAVGPVVTEIPYGNMLTPGTTSFTYAVNLGWAADGAIPLGSLLFAIAFLILSVHGKEEEEPEEEGHSTVRLADAIKAFEDKLALGRSSIDEVASKQPGSLSRADFDRIKADLDIVKGRAMQRLNEARQLAETKRYSDLLAQIQEAEREEDRASKDLFNLYEQYYTKRMREETFQRLLPNYKKRLDGSMNHLSDLLNAAQKEGR